MKKLTLLLVIFLTFITNHIYATEDNQKKDIAYYEDKLTNIEGKQLLIEIRKITSKTKQNNPDIAIHYVSKGLNLLKSQPDDKMMSDLYHNNAWAYITKSNFDKATKQANLSLDYATKAGHYSAQSHAVTALGAIHLYQGNTGGALNYFKQAKTFAELGKLPKDAATVSHNLAAIYQTLGDFDSAMEYMLQSRKLHLEQNDRERAAVTEGNMAEMYLAMENFDKALPYYRSALKVHEDLDNKWYIAKIKGMLALALIKQDKLDEAKGYIQQSILLFEELGEKVHLMDSIIAKGDIHTAENDHQKAIGEFMKALDLAEEVNSDLQIMTTSLRLAHSYFSIANYDTSLEFANVAFEKTKITKILRVRQEVEDIISQIYEKKQSYKMAYQHLFNFKVLSKTNREKEISDKNDQTENRFQTAKKEKQIELLTKDNQLKELLIERQTYERNNWIAGLVILILITFFLIYRQQQKRKLVNERANLMAELVEKKNQLLANVSHELRTPLTVLQLKVEALQHNLVEDVDASYKSLIIKIDDINNLISDIYQLAQSDIGALQLDLTSNRCSDLMESWSAELSELVKAKGFEWHQEIQVPDSLFVNLDRDKIKQVVSNLIDNSIAYTDAPGKIAMSSKIIGDQLEILIEDSSPGVGQDDLPRIFERLFRVETSRSRATGGSGLGLSICQSIIDAHNGTITSLPSKYGGLAISIKLKFIAE